DLSLSRPPILSQSTNQARRGSRPSHAAGNDWAVCTGTEERSDRSGRKWTSSVARPTRADAPLEADTSSPAQSGLFVLQAPDPPLATTGRDLSQRRQPQNSFCYISGAEPRRGSGGYGIRKRRPRSNSPKGVFAAQDRRGWSASYSEGWRSIDCANRKA